MREVSLLSDQPQKVNTRDTTKNWLLNLYIFLFLLETIKIMMKIAYEFFDDSTLCSLCHLSKYCQRCGRSLPVYDCDKSELLKHSPMQNHRSLWRTNCQIELRYISTSRPLWAAGQGWPRRWMHLLHNAACSSYINRKYLIKYAC